MNKLILAAVAILALAGVLAIFVQGEVVDTTQEDAAGTSDATLQVRAPIERPDAKAPGTPEPKSPSHEGSVEGPGTADNRPDLPPWMVARKRFRAGVKDLQRGNHAMGLEAMASALALWPQGWNRAEALVTHLDALLEHAEPEPALHALATYVGDVLEHVRVNRSEHYSPSTATFFRRPARTFPASLTQQPGYSQQPGGDDLYSLLRTSDATLRRRNNPNRYEHGTRVIENAKRCEGRLESTVGKAARGRARATIEFLELNQMAALARSKNHKETHDKGLAFVQSHAGLTDEDVKAMMGFVRHDLMAVFKDD